MKEAIVHGHDNERLSVEIQESPIPVPDVTQILIRVVVSGSNPKDWKGPVRIPAQNHTNTGDDIAGIVERVGSSVLEFKPGDRVASLHKLKTPHGSYAEFALGEECSTFHLPAHVTFEEGATIPLAAMTAALGLFNSLSLPPPWCLGDASARQNAKGGVVVYGASSAVGAFAIKLLRRAKLHPIIAVAGKARAFVEALIDSSQGDVIVDYRKGDDAVVEGIRQAIRQGDKLKYAFDAVSHGQSYLNLSKVLEPGGYITTVTPGHDYKGISPRINLVQTNITTAHTVNRDFAITWFRLFYYGLQEGWLRGHPYDVIPGGLNGLQSGLEKLQSGKASAVKYVYKIGTTEGS
ncbi:Quinone oxidoreductase [Trichoderma lentiforme]|uniref:Quinone oxidoreductase n=1 Tax=Trichoderma lentiforme TaxID=1567552 RepID=A0A9P5C6K5_9HYPO|nr:Quinone oxidoreductase [Trichoderma lentiforme]